MDHTVTALLPVLGVILGATLQFLFSRKTSEATHYMSLRTEAYVDYLKAIAELKFAQQGQLADKERDAFAQLTDAKARICIYGDAKVVDTLADFCRGGQVLDSPETFKSFVGICQSMRKCGWMGSQNVADKQLSQILIGEDI